MTSGIYHQGDQIFQQQGYDYYKGMIAHADGQGDDKLRGYLAKAFTSTAAAGGEFVPTEYSAQIIKYIYLESWARQAFGTFTISFGDTVKIPKFSTGFQPSNPDYLSAENTTVLGSATASREADQTTTEVENQFEDNTD